MAASQNPAAIDRHRILITLSSLADRATADALSAAKRARRRKTGNIPARN